MLKIPTNWGSLGTSVAGVFKSLHQGAMEELRVDPTCPSSMWAASTQACGRHTQASPTADRAAAPLPGEMRLHTSSLSAQRLPTSASALPQAPRLPSELPPWKVIFSRNLMNKTPSQPRSQQASRGLPHTLRLEQCPQTKPLIHRGREWWESGRGIPRAAQPLKGQLGFWVKIYMKIMLLCPASLPQPYHHPGGLWSDTFPPSILPWSHNPPLVTSQLLIQQPTVVMSQDSNFYHFQ